MVYFVYLCPCLRPGLYGLFFNVISVFIAINRIISLKQPHLVFGHFCQKSSLWVLLSFSFICCQFQPGVAYKIGAYTKKRVFRCSAVVQELALAIFC